MSITKATKAAIELLTALQEYPFSAFNEITLKRIPKAMSMHNMDEAKLILKRPAIDADTGDGLVSVEILGTSFKCNWMLLQFKTKDNMPVNIVLTSTSWTLRTVDFEIGAAEGSSVWVDNTSKKTEFNSSLHLKAQNAIRSVGERLMKRFSRVDSL